MPLVNKELSTIHKLHPHYILALTCPVVEELSNIVLNGQLWVSVSTAALPTLSLIQYTNDKTSLHIALFVECLRSLNSNRSFSL